MDLNKRRHIEELRLEKEKNELIKILINPHDTLMFNMSIDMEYLPRNSSNSTMWREDANKLFKKRFHTAESHSDILRLYNLSISLAYENSEGLAMGYGDRSEFHLHYGRYQDCITDIDRALNITKSNTLKVKLLCRKAKCLTALKDPTASDMSNEIHELLANITEEIKKKEKLMELVEDIKESPKFIDQSNKIVDENRRMHNLEELNEKADIFKSVEVKFDKKYGRHLIATQDFEPGEIIFVEKLYVTCLNPKKRKINCYHCFSTSWLGIPCDKCSWAIFCSEKCKKEAMDKYHDMECVFAPYLNNSIMPLRLLIMGLKEAGSVAKLRSELESSGENYEEFLRSKKVEHKLITACNLSSDVIYPKIDQKENLTMVLSIVRNLALQTSLFGKNVQFENLEDLVTNEDVIFVGALMLKLLKITDINTLNFSNVYEGKDDPDPENTMGSALPIVASLINHSCIPNVNHCFTKDKRIIIFAVRPIKKGSQLFNTYIKNVGKFSKEERQKRLEMYPFICECQACTIGFIDDLNTEGESMDTEESPKKQELRHLAKKSRWLQYHYDTKTCGYKVIEELSEAVMEAIQHLPGLSLITHSLSTLVGQAYRRVYDFEKNVYGFCEKKEMAFLNPI